jgi:hypothetical protein
VSFGVREDTVRLWRCDFADGGVEALKVRIPTQSGHRFRFEAGRRSDLKPATIPK